MALRHCYRMPAISVVRSARSFGRDHWSAQRIFRRAACAECGAIRWFLQSLEHLGANTLCGLIRGYSFRPKNAIRIEFGVLLPETQTALRNSSDPAPFPVTYLEHFRQYFLERASCPRKSLTEHIGSRLSPVLLRAASQASGSLPADQAARSHPQQSARGTRE